MNYSDFLERKRVSVNPSGFEPGPIHPYLFDWQQMIVAWALRQGKAALFEECGAGKTLQQAEWARHVQEHTNGRVLILSPLAVAHQTIAEAAKIGVEISYIRDETEARSTGVYITNYDMLKNFSREWSGVVLDESSILKNFTGQTKRKILETFADVPYKLACTATPAPNDHLELGNHAEFLDIMPSNEMIQRWFINDTMSAGSYRLKRHAESDYWQWVTSWAVCLSKPSDLGYPDRCERYTFDMPELIIHNEVVNVDHSRAWETGRLLVDGTISATDLWREKRATLSDRCQRAREIAGDSAEPWIIWCDTNDEADELMRLFPDAIEVRGNHSIAEKERRLSGFSDGSFKKIIVKPEIAGYGLNWQHCPNQIFVGLTYSFEKTYQALRRSWRFGQTRDVNAWMISAESEGDVVKTLTVKQEQHRQMQSKMNEAMRAHGLGYQARRERQTYNPTQTMALPSWIGA